MSIILRSSSPASTANLCSFLLIVDRLDFVLIPYNLRSVPTMWNSYTAWILLWVLHGSYCQFWPCHRWDLVQGFWLVRFLVRVSHQCCLFSRKWFFMLLYVYISTLIVSVFLGYRLEGKIPVFVISLGSPTHTSITWQMRNHFFFLRYCRCSILLAFTRFEFTSVHLLACSW